MIKFVVALVGIVTPTALGSLYLWQWRRERRFRALARRKKGRGVAGSGSLGA